jgi:hypothetical protein
MGPRRTVALVGAIGALVIALPSAAHAFGENGGTENAQLPMPAQGIGSAQTDQLPAKATQANVTVTPQLTDAQFFAGLSFALGHSVLVDFTDRVESCVIVTKAVIKNPNYFPNYTIPNDRTLQALFLAACLETALEVSLQQEMAARDASAGCATRTQAMSIQVGRSGSGYSAKVGPTTKRPRTRRPAYTMSCQITGRGLVLKIRPRKRGQRLRSAVGPTLQLGVVNPTSHPMRLKVSFTVK